MSRGPVGAGLALALALLAALAARPAAAGYFDVSGNFVRDPTAVAWVDFEVDPDRYVPDDADPACLPPAYTVVQADDALDGGSYATVLVDPSGRCAERFVAPLPADQGSYVARVWVRHGAIDATFFVLYADGSGLATVSAAFSPTGRATTDGWIELETNAFPADGAQITYSYLRVVDYASTAGVDVDALEVVRQGEYVSQRTCAGLGDPTCSSEEVCIYGQCALARLALPILPDDALRDAAVDAFEGKLELFYGGRFSRAAYLPDALARLETLRTATTAWEFWGGFAAAVHDLHDWHTDTFGGLDAFILPTRRLNACFFEADADLTHVDFPRDALYPDIVVSHAGAPETASGLAPGDRLLAVDGVHPIAWARALGGSNWDYHVATDPAVFADFAEQLGGPYWTGGSLLLKYAKTITVLRCDAAAGTCSHTPETIEVASIGNVPGGDDVACDNRPIYHVDGPDPGNHYVFGSVFTGPVHEATADEAIYTMVWDTLDGGGDPASDLNTTLVAAVADFKANARGVILDHRAGNGGTLDAASNVTTLVRPPEIAAALRIPIEVAGDDGPQDAATGLALFTQFSTLSPYAVGADAWATTLPVALVLHRDGSASDYMPFAMKGAPNVRLFGPHQTAGAFSTYISYAYWGGLAFQVASGDTLRPDGTTLIGSGVQPDEVVLPLQSDLLAGRDTIFDAALTWVRAQAAAVGP